MRMKRTKRTHTIPKIMQWRLNVAGNYYFQWGKRGFSLLFFSTGTRTNRIIPLHKNEQKL